MESILGHFITPQKKPVLISSHSPFPTIPQLCQFEATPICFVSPVGLPVLDRSCEWNHVLCGLCDLLLSLSTLFSSSLDSFLLLNNLPLYEYTTIHLSIHPSIDGNLDHFCFYFLL